MGRLDEFAAIGASAFRQARVKRRTRDRACWAASPLSVIGTDIMAPVLCVEVSCPAEEGWRCEILRAAMATKPDRPAGGGAMTDGLDCIHLFLPCTYKICTYSSTGCVSFTTFKYTGFLRLAKNRLEDDAVSH